jgi:hypothetical protein
VTHKSLPDHGPAQVELPVGIEPIEQCWQGFHQGDPRLDLGLGDKPWRYPYNGLLVDRVGHFRPHVTLGPHDAYLFDGGGYQGRSSDYFGNDKLGLPFEAEYTVRVEPIADSSTRVTVETYEYRIRVGSRMVITHAGSEDITKLVTPSHWDEYRVILCLAACLGIEKPLLHKFTPPHIDPKSDWLRGCRPFEPRPPKK